MGLDYRLCLYSQLDVYLNWITESDSNLKESKAYIGLVNVVYQLTLARYILIYIYIQSYNL